MGPDSLYCGKWRKISKSHHDLDLGPTMPNIKHELFSYTTMYLNFMFLDQFLLSYHAKTHTHTDSDEYTTHLDIIKMNNLEPSQAPGGYIHRCFQTILFR